MEARYRLCSPMDSLSMVLHNDDILQHIFLRLNSPSTLLRVSLVCKAWLRVVRDEGFLHRFGSVCPSLALGFFYVRSNCSPLHSFIPIGDACRITANSRDGPSMLDLFLKDKWRMIDSYNGFLILSKPLLDDTVGYILCNLCIHEFVAIPQPPLSDGETVHMFFLNATNAPSSIAFRFVFVSLCHRKLRVWVRSIEDNSWKRLTNLEIIVPEYSFMFGENRAIIIRGVLYWMVDVSFVLAIDVDGAKATVIRTKHMFDMYGCNFGIFAKEGGDLCLVGLHDSQLEYYSRANGGADMWMKTEVITLGRELACLLTEDIYDDEGEDDIEIMGTDESGRLLFLRVRSVIFSFNTGSHRLLKLHYSYNINEFYANFTLARTAWPPYFPMA